MVRFLVTCNLDNLIQLSVSLIVQNFLSALLRFYSLIIKKFVTKINSICGTSLSVIIKQLSFLETLSQFI